MSRRCAYGTCAPTSVVSIVRVQSAGSFPCFPCNARASVAACWRAWPARTDSEYQDPRQSHSRSDQRPYQRTRHTSVCGRGKEVCVRACLAWSSHRLSAHHRLRLVMRCSRTGMGPMLVGSESQERQRKRTTPETFQRLVGGSPHLTQGSPAHEIQAAKRLAACCCRKCYCRAQ